MTLKPKPLSDRELLLDARRRIEILERNKQPYDFDLEAITQICPVGFQFQKAINTSASDGPFFEEDRTNFYEGIWCGDPDLGGVYADSPAAHNLVVETNDPAASGTEFPCTDPEMIQLSSTTEDMPSSDFPFGRVFSGDFFSYDYDDEPNIVVRIRRPGVYVYNVNWHYNPAPIGLDWPTPGSLYIGITKPNSAFDTFEREIAGYKIDPEEIDIMQTAVYDIDNHRGGLIYVSEDAAATDPAFKVHSWSGVTPLSGWVVEGEIWKVADWTQWVGPVSEV